MLAAWAATLTAAACAGGPREAPWDGRIINVHEHIESAREVPKLLEAMDRLDIATTVLVGSSRFTITLRHGDGFTEVDANNERLIEIMSRFPGRFEAWPTLDPADPAKLAKLESLVDRGATGLKLYLGHGLVDRTTGSWMFRPVAMDDEGMLGVYELCERRGLPICFHVNPGPKTPGFAQEFIEVLKRYPDLKVNCPHFMLSSIRDSRLRELLDTFPNLVTDISFGHDDFLIAGLRRISRNPDKFRDLLLAYPDRFLFGTDCVITGAGFKDAGWIEVRYRAYLDMLRESGYETPVIPGTRLRGLELPPSLLERILYRNAVEFFRAEPRGTVIRRAIDWRKMGVGKVHRRPGQLLPPS